MREILFRGKCTRGKHSGKWVTGLLWHYKPQAAAIYSDDLDRHVWVHPETVGQFTGLTDKNGKKIFEGDIVRHYNRIAAGEPEAFEVGTIYWNTRFCAWARTTDREVHWGYVRIGDGCIYEVIGNIHDNPELLEANHAK